MNREAKFKFAMRPRAAHVALLLLAMLWIAFAENGHAVEANVPPDWLSSVQQEIAESEYRLTWQSHTPLVELEAAWQAPNREHGFRTYFTDRGIRVIPRDQRSSGMERAPADSAADSWEWSLRLARWGRPAALEPAEPARISVTENRADYDHGDVALWYVNDRQGLKQGFRVTSAPPMSGDLDRTAGGTDQERGGPVYLDLALEGTLSPFISADGQSIDFATAAGTRVVHYAELRVDDARRRQLPSWMEGFSDSGLRGIRIVFDDTDAVYPITIDPLATNPAWTAESNQAEANFGVSTATAGDVNGDGYSDVIVGAYLYDDGFIDNGRAYVYHGSAAGLGTGPARILNGSLPDGGQPGGAYGISVGTAGDVNGDGYSDVIVGQFEWTTFDMTPGRAYVYHGSAAGVPATPAWTATGVQDGEQFGICVSAAGDVNGDGYSDVIVGARLYDNDQPDEGRAYVYHGSAAGLAASPAWTVEGNQPSTFFGHSVATAGDVNADGYADVAVGAITYDAGQSDEGRAFVYHGSASGLSTTAAWTGEGNQINALYGIVGTAGDVTGDGFSDLIVGAYLFDGGQTDEGRAHVYHGSASGLSSVPFWTAESNQVNAHFGQSVGTAGDVDGDGYADVVVGAWAYDNVHVDEGGAFVYRGSPAGLSSVAIWTARGNQAGAEFGRAAAAGDVNGDGYADVIVGARLYDNPHVDEGRAFVYHGSASGLATSAEWLAESNQADARFGISVSTAGDVNGDGYADVIVGAPNFDTGQTDEGRAFVYAGAASGLSSSAAWTADSNQAGAHFGQSVSTAGDVDGDGYDDVVVGAENYDFSNGRAFVYRGSPTGLGSTAVWSAGGLAVRFGYSVANAGDVNADGYGDVVIGAPQASTGDTGWAFLYQGSSGGLGALPAWSASQLGGFFGGVVATAGDVNRDGFSDVAVGAAFFSNPESSEGRVLVYHGSPTGLAVNPSWAIEGNQIDGNLGWSVASAGDVNGDGYSDLVVGELGYTNGQIREGRALVYHGSPVGLAVTASWAVEANVFDSGFGHSVSTAGDVNGDGYADVVVTAPQYPTEQVFAYYGSAAGTSPTVSWTAFTGVTEIPRQTRLASSAGDVNGDGYADLVAGSYLYDSGETDEGRAFLYYGNGGRGLSMQPRQLTTLDTPVARLGASNSPSVFRLESRLGTPFGRGKLRMEWEVKPLTTLFNGSGTGLSVTVASGSSSTLSAPQTGLLSGTPYHWRIRLRYNSVTTPFAQHSRWYTQPWNGWQETRVRTCVLSTYYRDLDGDGYGDASHSVTACAPPAGHVANSMDCDDSNDAVHPGAAEICNGLDDDCDAMQAPDDVDADADGFAPCEGDCDNADASTYPSAPEINDGRDNQCAGDAGYGVVDEVSGLPAFPDTDTVCWPAQVGATSYEIARSTSPTFSGSCTIFTTTETCLTDSLVPPPSEELYYLIRAVSPNVGSWGQDSAGNERSVDCNTFQVSIGASEDNTLYDYAGTDLSDGARPWLNSGKTNSGLRRRAVIAFDVAGSGIPAGSSITGASLRLYLARTSDPSSRNMALHRLGASWDEGSSNSGTASCGGSGAAASAGGATWRHRVYSTTLWSTQGGDYVASASATTLVHGPYLAGPALPYSWTSPALAADVQGWLDNPAASFGWILLGDETVNRTTRCFASRESPTAANRPALTITYTTP